MRFSEVGWSSRGGNKRISNFEEGLKGSRRGPKEGELELQEFVKRFLNRYLR
jgi:hypothetical protein